MFKLFKFLKPYSVLIAVIFVLVFLQSLSELYLPNLMSDIVNTGIINGDTTYILRIGGVMILVTAGGAACSVAASFLTAKTSMGFGRSLRNEIFSHVEKFSLYEFDQLGTPSLITRNTNDVTQLQTVIMIMMRMMITAPIMCIGGIIMALSQDVKLSRVIVAVIPLLAAVLIIIGSKGLPLFSAIQEKLDKINLVLMENLTGIRVTRAFNRIDHEKRRFDEANLDLTNTTIWVNRVMAALMPVMMLVMNLTMIGVIWFGANRVDHGDLMVGDLMAFLQYAMLILLSLLMASVMFIMIPRAQVSAFRINEVLATKPGIEDAAQVTKTESGEGRLEFRNVTFSYQGAEEPVLKNISFYANPGEITAIIGGTGSGKSTLVNLIPRFYDIERGSILIDGTDIRNMSQEDLRAKIGFVPQNAVLFSGTIADNIRYGKPDATDEEVFIAAETAQATEFISGMKDGFASIIAQGGTNVSGGQKQRLSIARALVRKPEIYVFDDSFSALDFKTDALLRAALKPEIADATVLIVAQRVGTVMEAHRIIVLDKGRIVGIGNHRELLDKCEIYREIVSSQLSGEEIA